MKSVKCFFSPLVFAGVLGVVTLLSSCGKSVDNDMGGSSHLDVYLTDAPADYNAVWIDIQKVMVSTSTGDLTDDDPSWTEVPLVRPGLYNLLDFRNGADTVLAGVDLPAGTVSQIRLVLGSDNSLVLKDGSTAPLTTPSAQQSGLKLNTHAELEAGIPYALVLDFDASRSVVKAGNSNQYILKPVIRTFAKEAGGAIEGVVLPEAAKANVLAIMGTDTLGAIPDNSGYYKFWGVPAGAYQIIFSADSTTGYQSDTLSDIKVQTGEVFKVDTVTLEEGVQAEVDVNL